MSETKKDEIVSSLTPEGSCVTTLAHLEHFIAVLKEDIQFSRTWITRRKETMSKFDQIAQSQFPSFVDKDYVVENKLPFLVAQVSEPVEKTWPESANRMRTVQTVYLTIEFDDDIVNAHSPTIEPIMSVSFSVGEGYERDKYIDALREDALNGEPDTVVMTKWKKFYSLARVPQRARRVAQAS